VFCVFVGEGREMGMDTDSFCTRQIRFHENVHTLYTRGATICCKCVEVSLVTEMLWYSLWIRSVQCVQSLLSALLGRWQQQWLWLSVQQPLVCVTVGRVLYTEHSRLRSLAFDITQHIIFKRGVAFLVLANCSLLAVPVIISLTLISIWILMLLYSTSDSITLPSYCSGTWKSCQVLSSDVLVLKLINFSFYFILYS